MSNNLLSNISGTALLFDENSSLLNTGLPWTNPLKLQIGSDEHIIDTTINRGLMMLLNNDYYLDLKSNAISKELSSLLDITSSLYDNVSEHISDMSLHGEGDKINIITNNNTTQQINNNVYVNNSNDLSSINTSKLLKDTVKLIFIDKNAAQIQKIIDETPHDLNGFNLMFEFVIPSGFSESNNVSISRKF